MGRRGPKFAYPSAGSGGGDYLTFTEAVACLAWIWSPFSGWQRGLSLDEIRRLTPYQVRNIYFCYRDERGLPRRRGQAAAKSCAEIFLSVWGKRINPRTGKNYTPEEIREKYQAARRKHDEEQRRLRSRGRRRSREK